MKAERKLFPAAGAPFPRGPAFTYTDPTKGRKAHDPRPDGNARTRSGYADVL